MARHLSELRSGMKITRSASVGSGRIDSIVLDSRSRDGKWELLEHTQDPEGNIDVSSTFTTEGDLVANYRVVTENAEGRLIEWIVP